METPVLIVGQELILLNPGHVIVWLAVQEGFPVGLETQVAQTVLLENIQMLCRAQQGVEIAQLDVSEILQCDQV